MTFFFCPIPSFLELGPTRQQSLPCLLVICRYTTVLVHLPDINMFILTCLSLTVFDYSSNSLLFRTLDRIVANKRSANNKGIICRKKNSVDSNNKSLCLSVSVYMSPPAPMWTVGLLCPAAEWITTVLGVNIRLAYCTAGHHGLCNRDIQHIPRLLFCLEIHTHSYCT